MGCKYIYKFIYKYTIKCLHTDIQKFGMVKMFLLLFKEKHILLLIVY